MNAQTLLLFFRVNPKNAFENEEIFVMSDIEFFGSMEFEIIVAVKECLHKPFYA